jgi:hypothetical protein
MIYLLAYPRSGSSYIRYTLGFLTRSQPLQPHGHCEMDHLLSEYYENEPMFIKFHHPVDGGVMINKTENDTLILIRRNPIENILSYMFSNNHINKKGFTDEYMKNYINESINNPLLFKSYYSQFLENVNYFKNWEHNKKVFSYDNFLINPIEELVNVQNIFKFTDEKLDTFLKNINYHKELVLNHKMKKTDPFSVNTKGKTLDKFTNMLSGENLEKLQNKLKSDGLYDL